MKALDLFCGAGGASMGLHRAGFDVTGVDIAPQKHYPFRFVQADALTFPLDGYDVIWASPKCQQFSSLRYVTGKTYANQIPAMRARLLAWGGPWIIENVPAAPLHNAVMLCGTMFDLKVFRHRHFESNHLLLVPPHPTHDGTTGSHRWPYTPTGGYLQVTGNGGNFTLATGSAAMGIDWMTRDELSQAIPPAYSEYLARQLVPALEGAAA